jgi:hypothetical protein
MTSPKSVALQERIANASAKLRAARAALAYDDDDDNPQLVIYWYNLRRELLDRWETDWKDG